MIQWVTGRDHLSAFWHDRHMPTEAHSSVRNHLIAIHDAILLSNNAGLRFDVRHAERWNRWYLRAVTAIDTLAAGRRIVYLTSDLTREDEVGGTVLAFTDKTVIQVCVSKVEGPKSAGEVSARGRARRALHQVSATVAYPVSLAEEAGEIQYASYQHFELHFPDATVLIPITERATEIALDGAATLYSALIDDLAS